MKNDEYVILTPKDRAGSLKQAPQRSYVQPEPDAPAIPYHEALDSPIAPYAIHGQASLLKSISRP